MHDLDATKSFALLYFNIIVLSIACTSDPVVQFASWYFLNIVYGIFLQQFHCLLKFHWEEWSRLWWSATKFKQSVCHWFCCRCLGPQGGQVLVKQCSGLLLLQIAGSEVLGLAWEPRRAGTPRAARSKQVCLLQVQAEGNDHQTASSIKRSGLNFQVVADGCLVRSCHQCDISLTVDETWIHRYWFWK